MLTRERAHLDPALRKAMSKDPADRYQTAAEMRADVERAIAGLPVTADVGEMIGGSDHMSFSLAKIPTFFLTPSTVTVISKDVEPLTTALYSAASILLSPLASMATRSTRPPAIPFRS